MTMLRDIVRPAASVNSAAVRLEDGLAIDAKALINSFTPTKSSIAILRHIQSAVLPGAGQEKRAMIWNGVYGSGKSHLAVLIGYLLENGASDSLISPFLDKLKNQGEGALCREVETTFLSESDPDANPYLIVTLYGSPAPTLHNALLERLHQTLRDTEGLDPSSIMPKTEFAAANERLKTILELHPDYRQKPLSSWSIRCTAYNLEELEDQLEAVEPEALEAFKEWHPKVSAGAIFDPEDFGGTNVIGSFVEAAKNLSANHGYKGIAVIWDEFGYALENLIGSANRNTVEEIFFMQKFVE